MSNNDDDFVIFHIPVDYNATIKNYVADKFYMGIFS